MFLKRVSWIHDKYMFTSDSKTKKSKEHEIFYLLFFFKLMWMSFFNQSMIMFYQQSKICY